MAKPKSFEWHLQYFDGLSKESPDPRWKIGFEAAQLFANYHSDRDIAHPDQIISILMPYRRSGTGFLDFWGNVLGCIRDLPVHQQVSLWNEIFDPENQGEFPIDHNNAARAIIMQWLELDQNREALTDMEVVDKLARENYEYFLKAEEWYGLLFTIDQWYKTINPRFSLWDYIVELIRSDK